MATPRLNIIIFGATGCTGKYSVKQAARLSKEYQFTFGVAGRRKEVLEAVVKEYAPDIEDIPIICADLKDEESLKKMAERAQVIVNCCGPYRFYGEPVVKACIAAGTHHVDVSGEPQYMEKMQLEYNKAAQEAGVYIVSACGFDSIPCDLGVIFTQQKFEGEVNSVETYLESWKTTNARGADIHYGTWESAVYGLAHWDELKDLRAKLYLKKLPEFTPKLKTKSLVHRSSIAEGWSTLFPGADRSVIYRSQRFFYEKYNQRPVQVQTYINFKSMFAVLTTALLGMVFVLMTKSEFGRNLLLKYPSLFSAGFISREPPKPEILENTHFSIKFKAKGWTEKLAEPTDKHPNTPDKELITKVSGTNPGYGTTCVALVLSAVTILKEADKMPDNGGVLPPGAAFGKTSLIENLNKHDIKFEVISSIEK